MLAALQSAAAMRTDTFEFNRQDIAWMHGIVELLQAVIEPAVIGQKQVLNAMGIDTGSELISLLSVPHKALNNQDQTHIKIFF